MLYVICHMSYVICHMLYVICYMLYVICYMLYVICYMLYVICYMILHSNIVLRYIMLHEIFHCCIPCSVQQPPPDRASMPESCSCRRCITSPLPPFPKAYHTSTLVLNLTPLTPEAPSTLAQIQDRGLDLRLTAATPTTWSSENQHRRVKEPLKSKCALGDHPEPWAPASYPTKGFF